MTAPLTGKADTPDVPASPMPVATKPANKIVRIVMSPSIVTVTCVRPQSAFSLCAFFLMSPDSEGYLLAGVIDDIMIAVNLVFSTSQAFICCSFTDSILPYLLRRNIVAAIRGAADLLPTPASHRRRPNEGGNFFLMAGTKRIPGVDLPKCRLWEGRPLPGLPAAPSVASIKGSRQSGGPDEIRERNMTFKQALYWGAAATVLATTQSSWRRFMTQLARSVSPADKSGLS
jgi:hypothetical protein